MHSEYSQKEAQAFGQRLRQALIDAGVSPSATVIANEFNLRYTGTSITVHSARNWLIGKSLPRPDKLRALADWLKVNPRDLMLGPDTKRDGRNKLSSPTWASNLNMADEEVMRKYLRLSRENQLIVRSVVAAFDAQRSGSDANNSES